MVAQLQDDPGIGEHPTKHRKELQGGVSFLGKFSGLGVFLKPGQAVKVAKISVDQQGVGVLLFEPLEIGREPGDVVVGDMDVTKNPDLLGSGDEKRFPDSFIAVGKPERVVGLLMFPGDRGPVAVSFPNRTANSSNGRTRRLKGCDPFGVVGKKTLGKRQRGGVGKFSYEVLCEVFYAFHLVKL